MLQHDLLCRTVARPCTCAVVPSGNVIIGLLGSTWTILTVPSGLVIVCKTAGVNCVVICKKILPITNYCMQ